MKIFMVTDGYPPPLAGGREISAQLLSRELVRRGHDVDVLALAGPNGPRLEYDGQIRVHRLSGWSRIFGSRYVDPETPVHPTLPDPGLIRAVTELLRERRPDVVHARSWFLYSLLPILPSRKTRLVVSLHDYSFVCPKSNLIHRGGECSGPSYRKCVFCAAEQYGSAKAFAITSGMAVMNRRLKNVDRYIANSRYTARMCATALGCDPAEMTVIPPLIPEDAFQADRGPRPSFVPADGEYVMFAGALGPHKGVDVLLEAWAGLAHRPTLVLAGLRRFDSPRTYPEGVIVAENVPREDVLRGWGHCMAAVVPSVWAEPFGVVAVEAMAAGRPVVASAVGGLADIVVDGVTGLHVRPGDTGQLRNALERLVADRSLRERLGAAGRARAASYSLERGVGAWVDVYRDVVGTAGVAAPTTDRIACGEVLAPPEPNSSRDCQIREGK